MWGHTVRYRSPENVVDEIARVLISHFTSPWVIIALLEAGESVFRPEVLELIRWILGQQDDEGYLKCPIVVSRVPIWATHDALFMLKTFLEKVLHPSSVLRLLDQIEEVSQKIESLSAKFNTILQFLPLFKALFTMYKQLQQLGQFLRKVGRFSRKYWSILILLLFLASPYPLTYFMHLTIKEVLVYLIILIALVILQVILEKFLRKG
ncbi:MAG: hypothetical protein AOA65_2268 [Candidatus Bathyarchaeota archaeon BA1]|nr:MAG: hypothetical protein AOA65_2268 [Candidatus Bathyarchaeota archaeon BA1]